MNATAAKTHPYYVKAIIMNGRVFGYGIYDCIGDVEREHANYHLEDHSYDASVTLHLANLHRDDLNAGIA